MKRVELLSPVGNMDMLYQAVHNGADAVYLAGKDYGARKFARNFTNEELLSVVHYCHLYGVKVYVVVNTLIYQREIEDVLAYIEFLYQIQVDALIMQDLGVISLVRKKFPYLEIHASTQCHNDKESSLRFWKNLGLTRVVLAREVSLDEINKMNVAIQKEVFIYGALCVSYSGCCLFSSLNGGRSGNRGECSGCCRLPYRQLNSRKSDYEYLLSTKDLNVLNDLSMLMDSGIDCFKIEGRMKSPEYVGYVTRCARKIIDAYDKGIVLKLTDSEEMNLKKLFHREFTRGYLMGEKNIINKKSSNHQGIVIGNVIHIHGDWIKIKITDDFLHQEDGIRFQNSGYGMIVNRLYDSKKLLTQQLSCGEIGYLKVDRSIQVGDILLKTSDDLLQKELLHYKEKKIPISITVKAYKGNHIFLEVRDDENVISVTGDVVMDAIRREVCEEDIKRQLSKWGNTPFIVQNITILKDENIFVRLGHLNDIRRDACSKLISLRENKEIHKVEIRDISNHSYDINYHSGKFIHVLVRNEEQLKEVLRYKVSSIYVMDYSLYLKYKDDKRIFYRVSRIGTEDMDLVNERLLIGDLGNLYQYQNHNKVIGDHFLNVVNSFSANELGLSRVTVSLELKDEDLFQMISSSNVELEKVIYGRPEIMVCKNSYGDITIENQFKKKFMIRMDHGVSHIFHSEVLDDIDKISFYHDKGLHHFRIELFDEDKENIQKIFQRIIS